MAPRKKTKEEAQNLPGELPVEKPVDKAKEPSARKTKVMEVVAKGPETEQAQPQQPKMEKQPARTTKADRGALILGGGMLFMGLLLLLGQFLHFSFGELLWPFIFIVPGVLVFITAITSESGSGEGLSILGGILTMLGLVFLADCVTGFWASWAYSWALIAPTSVGLAQMIYGTRKNRETIVNSGRKLVNLGMFMFAIGFVFFELVLGISGFGLGSFGIPVALIAVGLFVLLRSLAQRK
jgi:protein-S-isoprenylcysteine O-methyltransferase Ste14